MIRIYCRPVILILFLITSLGLTFCSDTSVDPVNEIVYQYAKPAQQNDGWQTATMSDVNMHDAPMVSLMESLGERNDHHVNSILIIKNNRLVFEEYFDGRGFELEDQFLTQSGYTFTNKAFDSNTTHFMASVTKSLTSALVGIAIDFGFIDNINKTVFSYFPEYSNLSNPAKDQITLEHMLTMTSGIPWYDDSPYYNPANDEHRMFLSQDPLKFVLSNSLVSNPGASFWYNSGTTVLLGEIVKRSSGMSVSDFSEEYLFRPMGITDYFWTPCRNAQEVAFAGGGLYLRPRDMAKIGQLYLQDGSWNGEQVISSGWIEDSRTLFLEISPDNELENFAKGYGYQWWIGSFTTGHLWAYLAGGWGGQYIIVIPDQDMVVVVTQDDYYGEDSDMIFSIILNVLLSS